VLRRFSIIVAEDERYLRDWLVSLVESLGGRVRAARDGWELMLLLCRAIASGDMPDLVVSDLHMPRATGLEVLDAMRGLGVKTPFLLITGAGSPELRTLAATLHATVLDKPFSASVFRSRVGEVCQIDFGGDRGPALA
jgi:CheY-like chemotaxis protein